jgi:hypothetical protein
MKKPVLLILCLALLLGSCIEKKNADAGYAGDMQRSAAAGRNMERIDHFMRRGPAFPVGGSLAEIKRNLGKPAKEDVTERRNIHNKALVDEIHKLYYDGLYIEVYHVTEMKKDILLVLEVTGEEYPLAYGLQIGITKKKIRDTLGNPNEERPGLWRYFASDFVMGSFEFGFQNDAAVSIRWYYSID